MKKRRLMVLAGAALAASLACQPGAFLGGGGIGLPVLPSDVIFEALNGPLRVPDVGETIVTLTDPAGVVSKGKTALEDGWPVFELIRGGAFVTTKGSSGALRAQIYIFIPRFRTRHILLGTEGTSFLVQIDPEDDDTVSWSAVAGTVYLRKRDKTPWASGALDFPIPAGETYQTVEDQEPVRQPDLAAEEINFTLQQVDGAAAEDDPRHVPFVVGMERDEAVALIEDAELVPVTDDLAPGALVASSDPVGGQAVQAGSEVRLSGES